MMTKTQTQTDTKSSNQSPEMTINVLDAPLISLNLAGNVGNRFILYSPTRHCIHQYSGSGFHNLSFL